ncbi:MAG: AAA family ATPase [Bacteroidaceae bacterium]|nr:AAA family ATPase [Bacteroidaceae bacterium]
MSEHLSLYEPESAAERFDSLFRAVQAPSDVKRMYAQLNRIFNSCLNEHTSFAGLRFNGPFAKTDYLLNTYHASRQLRQIVNAARVRLRHYLQTDEQTLANSWPHDLQALALFIALIYDADVPPTLVRLFPTTEAHEHTRVTADYLRVIVSRWDDHFIYGRTDSVDSDDQVSIRYTATNESAPDWSYLKPYLHEGCQLNIVRPRVPETSTKTSNALIPEQIIYEPDYLVDISAIAACFEEYGASPLNHLLNRLKPAPTSAAILLGNLASQFLDEELFLAPEEENYAESIKRFFQANALGIATTDLPADFHAQARTQKQNIHTAIRQGLEANVTDIDPENVMLEPSFFSEMLGLQGRMDYLHLDYRVLIEQKSGRGGFPQRDPDVPVYQQKHYIQLLLYMLLIRYNFRQRYELNRHELNAFLLYSKYAKGLIGCSFAPELVHEAVRVRNGISALDFSLTHGSITLLDNLRVDDLNIKGTSSTLWTRYQRPQLEALLAPIHSASPLERAYYHRLITFVATEHLLAKLGNQTKENSGFADKWYSSLADKLLAGNIYHNMTLVEPEPTAEGCVSRVVLHFDDTPDHDVSNFRRGDIVILYPYNPETEPDARKTMVFRSTIEEIKTDTLSLALRATQTHAHVFRHYDNARWAIEHDFMEASFSSLYRGLHAFLSAPQQRRDLTLLQRTPVVDNSLTLRGDYGPFNELALRVRQAQDLFLIIGPPGTGKTSYGLMTTLREELHSPDARVLLMAYTNRAIDEICSKLEEDGIDYLRIGSPLSCERAYHSHLLSHRVDECQNVSDVRQLIVRSRVFVGTTTSITANQLLFTLCRFTLAIIDEASQILEPQLIGILSATTPDGTSAINKFVMIGDHKQLPAVVGQGANEAHVDDPLLQAIHLTDCRQSLFQRLLMRYHDNPEVVYLLTRQGRMHPIIADFPNRAFYEGRLAAVPCPHQQEVLPPSHDNDNSIDSILASQRIAFIATPLPDDTLSEKVNMAEAEMIAAAVVSIYRQEDEDFDVLRTVGVIVPYRNQIAAIRTAIDHYGISCLHEITIDTVERFQGSQRDYILYGFTIRRRYQLQFLTSNTFEENGRLIDRKLNVAMTRARKHLLLFGNPDLLRHAPVFAQLIAFAQTNGYFYDHLPDA